MKRRTATPESRLDATRELQHAQAFVARRHALQPNGSRALRRARRRSPVGRDRVADSAQHVVRDVGDLRVRRRVDARILIEARRRHLLAPTAFEPEQNGRDEVVWVHRAGGGVPNSAGETTKIVIRLTSENRHSSASETNSRGVPMPFEQPRRVGCVGGLSKVIVQTYRAVKHLPRCRLTGLTAAKRGR